MERELREKVESVRERLAAGAPLGENDRQVLERILTDLSGLLEGDEGETHESLAERLRDATGHFEEEHSDLTLAVGAVADVLSRMGI